MTTLREAARTALHWFEANLDTRRCHVRDLRMLNELRTAVAQERKPLTNDQIVSLPEWEDYLGGCITLLDFARGVERAHEIT